MNKYVRRTLKGLLWTVTALLLLIAVQVSVLAFPSPWFEHSARADNVILYSNRHQGPELESLARGVLRRVEAIDIYNKDVRLRAFLCNEQGLYNLFARLALVPTYVPGFDLSIFNNSFISIPTLERRSATRHPGVEHSALTGDLEECIAHELVHDYVQERIGFFSVRRAPRWKQEGYVEYQANKAALSGADTPPLADRISTMLSLHHGRAREYYEWNLIVEFLSVECGYNLERIIDESVTLDAAREQMMAWYANTADDAAASGSS